MCGLTKAFNSVCDDRVVCRRVAGRLTVRVRSWRNVSRYLDFVKVELSVHTGLLLATAGGAEMRTPRRGISFVLPGPWKIG